MPEGYRLARSYSLFNLFSLLLLAERKTGDLVGLMSFGITFQGRARFNNSLVGLETSAIDMVQRNLP